MNYLVILLDAANARLNHNTLPSVGATSWMS